MAGHTQQLSLTRGGVHQSAADSEVTVEATGIAGDAASDIAGITTSDYQTGTDFQNKTINNSMFTHEAFSILVGESWDNERSSTNSLAESQSHEHKEELQTRTGVQSHIPEQNAGNAAPGLRHQSYSRDTEIPGRSNSQVGNNSAQYYKPGTGLQVTQRAVSKNKPMTGWITDHSSGSSWHFKSARKAAKTVHFSYSLLPNMKRRGTTTFEHGRYSVQFDDMDDAHDDCASSHSGEDFQGISKCCQNDPSHAESSDQCRARQADCADQLHQEEQGGSPRAEITLWEQQQSLFGSQAEDQQGHQFEEHLFRDLFEAIYGDSAERETDTSPETLDMSMQLGDDMTARLHDDNLLVNTDM